MPLFRCPYRPKLSNKCNVEFDPSSWPNHLRNVFGLDNNNEQQKHQIIHTIQRYSFLNPYDWKHKQIKENDHTNGQSNRKDDKYQTNSHKYDFNSINIRFLETLGVFGTALVVGLDLRSRFNQWTLIQREKSFQDYCKHYERTKATASNVDSNQHHEYLLRLSHDKEKFQQQSNPTSLNDLCLVKTSSAPYYCGYCHYCGYIFDKLSLYATSFLSSNVCGCITNIIDGKITPTPSPSTSQNVNRSNEIKINECRQHQVFENDDDDDDNVVEEKNIFDKINKELDLCPTIEKKTKIISDESDFLSSISSLYEEDRESIEDKQTYEHNVLWQEHDDDDDNDEPITGNSNDEIQCHSPSKTSEPLKTSNDQEDLAAVFSKTCIEYEDFLNNLSAIELMDKQKPLEAMECWSSCKSSSAALFNMGVSYESGRHRNDDDVKPDMDLAYYYYALSAMMGHPLAIYNLALFYIYGKGSIKQDIQHGMDLLRIAANKGVHVARQFCQQFENQKQMHERSSMKQSTNKWLNSNSQHNVDTIFNASSYYRRGHSEPNLVRLTSNI